VERTTARVNGGVGNIVVEIPTGVAANIRLDRGLGNVSVDERRFPRSGDHYLSEGFATAERKLELDIDGGVGNITVR
jgi:hypothetical protein